MTNDRALAIDALRGAADNGFDAAFGHLAEALRGAGRPDDALAAALRGLERAPSDFKSLGMVVRLLLDRDEPERLWTICADLRATGVWNAYVPSAMALAATTASQHAEVEALIDSPRWFAAAQLGVPDGFNERLSAELLAHASASKLPSTKATSGAGRRIGQLQLTAGPVARDLLARIRAAVDAYAAQRQGGAAHPMIAARPAHVTLNAWALAVHDDGHEDWHMHPGGWVSGVYYAAVPAGAPRGGAHDDGHPGRDRVRTVSVRRRTRRAIVAALSCHAAPRLAAAVPIVLRTPHVSDARRRSADRRRVRRGSRSGARAAALMHPITGATVVSRSPSVVTAEIDGEIMMMSIEHGRYWNLDDVGTDIWRRIDPPCSFDGLVDALAAEYDAERAMIAADVQSLLQRMLAEDVVRLT